MLEIYNYFHKIHQIYGRSGLSRYHVTIITAYHADKLSDSIFFFANGNLIGTIFHYFGQRRGQQRVVTGREPENKRKEGTKFVPGRNEVGIVLSLETKPKGKLVKKRVASNEMT